MSFHYTEMSKAGNLAVTAVDGLPGKCIPIADGLFLKWG